VNHGFAASGTLVRRERTFVHLVGTTVKTPEQGRCLLTYSPSAELPGASRWRERLISDRRTAAKRGMNAATSKNCFSPPYSGEERCLPDTAAGA
jgi:hypothetical protein